MVLPAYPLPGPLEALDLRKPTASHDNDFTTVGPPQRKLRIAIVSENLMPKVDGVTRCLARLLAHLREQGHEAVVFGPQSGMTHYETHPLVGTFGIPLVLYPGLKLNFLRPRFLRVIHEFNPDVIHIVEPVWLGAQFLLALQFGWCGEEWMADGRPGLGRGVGGAVVASYHTNLPTYATLFGMPWLEPIMWRWVRWLHRKCLLTACPSNSTAQMLQGRGIDNVRIWSRGVDLELFGPHRRNPSRRERWGIKICARTEPEGSLAGFIPKNTVLPLTPPPSPDLLPVGDDPESDNELAVLYVGRISYEKNLLLLIYAMEALLRDLPPDGLPPTLVLVGDGPAKPQLQELCTKLGVNAVFEGHLSGESLAECYASADIFAFPSYTETFGQVVLEALASGLPVIGLDAEGTRDLVSPGRTGLLLTKPPSHSSSEWCAILSDAQTSTFRSMALAYSDLLSNVVFDNGLRRSLRQCALDEGTRGRTWFDAMEAMVDCYREGIMRAGVRRPIEPTAGRRRGWPGFFLACAVAGVMGLGILGVVLII